MGDPSWVQAGVRPKLEEERSQGPGGTRVLEENKKPDSGVEQGQTVLGKSLMLTGQDGVCTAEDMWSEAVTRPCPWSGAEGQLFTILTSRDLQPGTSGGAGEAGAKPVAPGGLEGAEGKQAPWSPQGVAQRGLLPWRPGSGDTWLGTAGSGPVFTQLSALCVPSAISTNNRASGPSGSSGQC